MTKFSPVIRQGGGVVKLPDAGGGQTLTALKVNQWLPEWGKVRFSTKLHRREPNPYFYIFKLRASWLKSLAGIQRRTAEAGQFRSEDLGIQRRHDQRRSDEIREFVQYGFPWCELNETKRELDFDFPVYLLVTKCDLIEGFKDYFSLMPSRIASEVVGWIDQEALAATGAQARGSAEALQRFRAGVHSIYERLHFLRLSMLNGRTPEALRQPIFCFPEEFRAIERPLMIFAQQVIGRQAIYRTPMFRGVFFLSAKQEGTPVSSLRRELGILAEPAAYDGRAHQHYFLQELFGTILPRDRTLAAPATARSKSA